MTARPPGGSTARVTGLGTHATTPARRCATYKRASSSTRAEGASQMPSNKPGSRLIRAAGGVAWRPGPDGEPEILLVHRKKYDDWSLPKGKTEPDEPLPVTAVREVLEEGGARLALGRRLVSVRYNVGGRPKRVHYWAARVLSVDSRAIPNAEVDEVAWLPADRAVEKVSYPHDHGVLADFAARPPQTVPLILLRHAKALPKGGWKRADADRPLDDSGRYAAKALADRLPCFAPSFRLISSPAARCTETLRPLSELTGDPVRHEPSLYIHNKPLTEAADPGTVNASGGKATADGAAGGAFELPADWDETLPTSGFWVLNIAPRAAKAEPGPEPTALAAPAARPGPARRRTWWQRLRALARRGDPRQGGDPGDGDAGEGDTGSGNFGE